EPSGVEVAGGVAYDHESVAVHARHREVASLGYGFRAGREHLAAREDLADGGMRLEALELVMRVERGIAVVEADDETDVDDSVRHAVDECAAEGLHVERPAHGVDDRAGGEAVVGQLPDLLDADR